MFGQGLKSLAFARVREATLREILKSLRGPHNARCPEHCAESPIAASFAEVILMKPRV